MVPFLEIRLSMVHPLVKKYSKVEGLEERINQICADFDQSEYLTDRNFFFESVVRGNVISYDDNYVYVDLNYKSDGKIPLSEISSSQLRDLEKGVEIKGFIENFDSDTGMPVLSQRKAEKQEIWEKILKDYGEGAEIECVIMRPTPQNNGLLVDLGGMAAFLPISQITDRKIVEDLEEYVDQPAFVEILKIDKERKNIIVSRKKVIERNKRNVRRSILEEMRENEVREGVVKNITNYGAFIDLGGIDGLLHITDISWNRINHPKDVLDLNQKINVKILKIDNEKERVSLGLKQLQPNPWKDVDQQYRVGNKVSAKVTNINNRTVCLKLDSGVEGLMQMEDINDIEIGQTVNVEIKDINPKNKKIELSLC